MFKAIRNLVGRKSTRGATIVAAPILNNAAAIAKRAFFVVGAISGLMTASILTSKFHPILAGLGGLVAFLFFGFLAWTAARLWPVVRWIWWWLTEIIFVWAAYKLFAFVATTVPNVWVRTGILLAIVGIPAAIGPVRRFVLGWGFCVAVRHRIRVCFTDVIKTNQHGSLPLILMARPTPAGERVWVFLRPGLSISDIMSRLEGFATACWASSMTVQKTGSNIALLRLDITRREVLNRMVTSPLPTLVEPNTPMVTRPAPTVPTQLNLSDLPLFQTFTPSSAKVQPSPKAATPNGARSLPDPEDFDPTDLM